MKRRKRKLKYTVPRIQPLQEMVAEAACTGGSGGTGNCQAGYTATVICVDGTRDNQCVSQSYNCTNGGTPSTCTAGTTPYSYCCKTGQTALVGSWLGCYNGIYPSNTCQTGTTKSTLCKTGTSP